MVSALQHQAERCSVELRSRKPSDTLVPGGMDSPPTPMYVVHSPSEPRKRCIGVEVIGTTLHVLLNSVDAHHSTCWYSTYGLAIVGPHARVCARPLRIGVREGALCPKA
eukprot:scaffold22785_cov72-Phaeocystis_antarctica.AAC.6